MTDAGDVLLDARNYLATGKWRKEIFTDGDGNGCVMGALFNVSMGALFDVSRSAAVYLDAKSALEQHIGPECTGSEIPLVAFNDHPDTTLADILSLFDKALADLGRLGDAQ